MRDRGPADRAVTGSTSNSPRRSQGPLRRAPDSCLRKSPVSLVRISEALPIVSVLDTPTVRPAGSRIEVMRSCRGSRRTERRSTNFAIHRCSRSRVTASGLEFEHSRRCECFRMKNLTVDDGRVRPGCTLRAGYVDECPRPCGLSWHSSSSARVVGGRHLVSVTYTGAFDRPVRHTLT